MRWLFLLLCLIPNICFGNTLYVVTANPYKDGMIDRHPFVTVVPTPTCLSDSIADVDNSSIDSGPRTVGWDLIAGNFPYRSSGYFSFNTSGFTLANIDSCILRLAVWSKHKEYWDTDLEFKFNTDCISNPLVAIDTLCFSETSEADTTILYSNVPEDTLFVRVGMDKINTSGYTDIIIRSVHDREYCSLLFGYVDLVLFYSGVPDSPADSDPVLLLYVKSSSCPCCHGS